MLSEDLFSSVCGPPLAANTAVSKDVGIYAHSLTPSWAAKASFKKSSTPAHCLALSDTHVFAAQDQKAHVHVYSRLRGNQEALIPFPEKIRSIAFADDVLVVGTAEGRLILWETCTGRQISTPPCHMQAVSCIAVTPHHILSASDDTNINVWSLARLLESGTDADLEPELTLSNHRGAITSLIVGSSTNAETSICVSSSKDKTCIIWNYRTGQVLRTLLFPSSPLSLVLDPCARSLFVSTEDGAVYLVELYGDKPLLGSRSVELSSIVVQVDSPLGVADADAGPASCLAVAYDGTSIYTGHTKGKILRWSLNDNSHPTEMANLNAAVTNLVFAALLPDDRLVRPGAVVKPSHGQRQYTLTSQLVGSICEAPRFDSMFRSQGFSSKTVQNATMLFADTQPAIRTASELEKENQELREIVNEQRALQKTTIARLADENK